MKQINWSDHEPYVNTYYSYVNLDFYYCDLGRIGPHKLGTYLRADIYDWLALLIEEFFEDP